MDNPLVRCIQTLLKLYDKIYKNKFILWEDLQEQ